MKVIDKIKKAEEEAQCYWSFEYFPPKTPQVGSAGLEAFVLITVISTPLDATPSGRAQFVRSYGAHVRAWAAVCRRDVG